MISYDHYRELLSKVIHRTITDVVKEMITSCEAALEETPECQKS